MTDPVKMGPGKFQGEHPLVPHLWDLTLESSEDDIFYGVDDTMYSVFEIDEAMQQEWDTDAVVIVLWEDNFGFVNSAWYTSEEDYEVARTETEDDGENKELEDLD
jgi:hypothetical protein